MLEGFATHPVHQTNVCQHEEVDLEQQASLRRRIRRHAPDGDTKSMEETHRKLRVQMGIAVLHNATRCANAFFLYNSPIPHTPMHHLPIVQ